MDRKADVPEPYSFELLESLLRKGAICGAAIVRESGDDEEILRIVGDFGLLNSQLVESAIEQVASFARPVLIDLAFCSYVDMSALSVLVRAKRALKQRLKISSPEDGRARRVFDLAGVSGWLIASD